MEIKTVGVVGCGLMGHGIAQVTAQSGYRVVVREMDEAALEKGLAKIEQQLSRSVEKGRLEEGEIHAALACISATDDLEEAVSGAELVVEAVLEKMDLKLELFKRFDGLCEPETVLATNTSTMSPTEIAAATERPGRCIAMHFFNPAHRMKLVELVRGVETTDETVEVARSVAESMGKETVEVNEFPGFVTSRINCLVGNEAMNMLVEGVASAPDIDKALKLGLGYPMGPLELADLVGLDTRLRNLEYLHETLGEKYRPSPLLRKRVAAGHLGKKSGRGIYEYTEDGDVVRP